MASHVIAVIGSLNTDLVTVTPRVPLGGETLTASQFFTGAGGKGANQAVASVRASRNNPHVQSSSPSSSDITVRMVGAVGSDSFGSDLISGMKKDGIDTSSISTVNDQPTGVAVILVEESTGENRILLNPGANHSLQPSDFENISSFGPRPDLIILQLEIPLKTVLQVMKVAKEAGIQILLNPAPAIPLPGEVFNGLDHLIVNETEAAILSGRKAEDFKKSDVDWESVTDAFLAKGVKNIVVTLGSKGAYFSGKTGKGKVDAEKGIVVVDTTAAGDTFVGAYAVEIVREKLGAVDMGKAVSWACKAAGRTVEKAGAQGAIPWADEIDR